jgi:hypothetical protein
VRVIHSKSSSFTRSFSLGEEIEEDKGELDEGRKQTEAVNDHGEMDDEEEGDDIDDEIAEDVAKSWGQFTKVSKVMT